MSSFSLIDFARDIGKHLTVNYMMSKDSVKKRLGSDAKEGMSFTEFSYQLIQGYDFSISMSITTACYKWGAGLMGKYHRRHRASTSKVAKPTP